MNIHKKIILFFAAMNKTKKERDIFNRGYASGYCTARDNYLYSADREGLKTLDAGFIELLNRTLKDYGSDIEYPIERWIGRQ